MYHEHHRDEPGPGRERLRRMALPMEDEALVLLLIDRMRESGVIHSHHGWLHLPDHKAGFSDEQQAVWQNIEPLFGDDPWWGARSGERKGRGRAGYAAGAATGGTAGHDYRDRERSLLP
ncbi:selenocysteinyl-tRNA-specific translation factor [Citrobacter koseri]|uniref:Selenocysteinyl-tRNA-specific translation factor n=1 Tax=Citrobacter koseri TaxID=545 RepID=A0A2X2WJ93_CITKO|nr:selenocysteinyl-tRNA-specific translation factor [Citrobacter koseri]